MSEIPNIEPPLGETGEAYYCKRDEFLFYIFDQVNPKRAKAKLPPLDRKTAEECYRILNDFARQWGCKPIAAVSPEIMPPTAPQLAHPRPTSEGWWWRYRENYGFEPGQCLMRIWYDGQEKELIWFGPGCSHRVSEIAHGEWYPAEMPTRTSQISNPQI